MSVTFSDEELEWGKKFTDFINFVNDDDDPGPAPNMKIWMHVVIHEIRLIAPVVGE